VVLRVDPVVHHVDAFGVDASSGKFILVASDTAMNRDTWRANNAVLR
jgi:hypothetical protein